MVAAAAIAGEVTDARELFGIGPTVRVPLADSTIYEMEKRGNGTQH